MNKSTRWENYLDLSEQKMEAEAEGNKDFGSGLKVQLTAAKSEIIVLDQLNIEHNFREHRGQKKILLDSTIGEESEKEGESTFINLEDFSREPTAQSTPHSTKITIRPSKLNDKLQEPGFIENLYDRFKIFVKNPLQLLNQSAKEPEEEESTENSTPEKQGNELKTQEKNETQEKQQPVSSTMGTENEKINAIKKEEQTKATFNATMGESLSSLFKNLLSGIAIFNEESKRNTTRFIKDKKLAKPSISPSQESEFVRRLKLKLVCPKTDNIDLTYYSTIDSSCDFLDKTIGFNKTQIALITELAQFHQRENETIYEYYSRLKDLSEELEAAQRRDKPEHIFFSQNIQNLCLNVLQRGLSKR
uniref:Retrotransposon gag domain-containing protein n=1 Tax=Trichogramma kaykai TaxID=54128 RepID=A0ABD2W863_9HYME